MSFRFGSGALVLASAMALSTLAYAEDEEPKEQQEPQKEPPKEAPKEAAPVEAQKAPPRGGLKIDPFVGIAGGVKADLPINRENEHRQARVSTIAISRFGLRGSATSWLSFESELMASGGASLHGTSSFEGQASLQLRNQLIRLTPDRFVFEVGRVTDEASVDYFSAHVADTFLQDTAVRDPLLYSGYNMGNGVRGTVKLVEGLRFGLAFNAGNPVSSTAALMVGGTFSPFDRFYSQPYQAVGKSPNNFPDDTFHMMVLTPSLLYSNQFIEAKAAFQGLVVDTDTTKSDDQNIRGYNIRANMKLKLLNDMLVPFGNFAFTRNDTVEATNNAKLGPDKYTAVDFGGGIDFNYMPHPFACPYACANGLGVQYTQIQYQTGQGNVSRLHFVNVGTSYWITDHLAFGARVAAWIDVEMGPQDTGERSAMMTLRYVM